MKPLLEGSRDEIAGVILAGDRKVKEYEGQNCPCGYLQNRRRRWYTLVYHVVIAVSENAWIKSMAT